MKSHIVTGGIFNNPIAAIGINKVTMSRFLYKVAVKYNGGLPYVDFGKFGRARILKMMA